MVVAIRSCLGVDIGSQCIRVAVVEMAKAGPRIVQLLEEPLKVDPALGEAQRQQAIGRQLQELLKRGQVRVKNAIFCIPGQSVFIKRPPKMPKTTPERLDRIIRFEARQQIPFPLDKTIMEYQVFEEGESSEVNVLLAAIKRDYILNFMKLVKRTGLRPLAISVSSLALYNFHELNSSSRDLLAQAAQAARTPAAAKDPKGAKANDKAKAAKPAKGLFGLGKKKDAAKPEQAESVALENEAPPLEEAAGFEEVRAYVNLGASLMDLAIPKTGTARMIGFTRSVPLAGNAMDAAIREKLGLEDLAQARALKESKAAVLSTEFEVEADPEAFDMEACEVVTAVADRIISELRRSLDYYISQPDGVAVDVIELSGGLARLPYLRSYIEEKMGLPVELAEARHAQLRLPDPAPETLAPFIVATGLALQGLGLAQNTINFLPEDVKTIQSVRQRPQEMIGMAAMLLVMVGLSFNVGANYASQYKREVEGYGQTITALTLTDAKIKAAEARNQKIGEAYTKLARASGWRDFWFFVLQGVILEARPGDVILDEVQLRLDGTVIISGKSPKSDSANRFFEDLKRLGGFFVIKTEYIVSPVQAKTDPRFSTPVYDFTIVAKVRKRQARLRTIGAQPESPMAQTGGRSMYGGTTYGSSANR